MKPVKIFSYALLFVAIASCSQGDIDGDSIIDGGDRMVIALSPAEYLSIAFDGNNELTSDDAENILSDFLLSNNQFRSSGKDVKFSLSRSYYVNLNENESETRSSSPEQSKGNIKVMEFNIQSHSEGENKQADGFALVSADKRFPEVLAFVQSGDIENSDVCGASLMLKRAQHIALNYALTIEKYQEELRDKTIEKISQFYKKPYSFEKVKDLLLVKDISSNTDLWGSGTSNPPGIPVATIEPMIKVEWIQGGPQNQFINSCAEEHLNVWPEFIYGGRYPAGCTAVAVASVLSYFQPTLYSDSLKRNINWNTALSYRKITWFSPEDAPYVIEAAGILQAVAKGIGTTYGRDGGSANMNNAVAYMKKLGITVGSKTQVSYLTIRPSIGRYRPVILTGTARKIGYSTRSETSGSHAWVMDGIKIMQRPSTMAVVPNAEMNRFNNFGHCNFGWNGGAYNGWYLFDSNGYINFDCGDTKYDIGLNAYPDIRK